MNDNFLTLEEEIERDKEIFLSEINNQNLQKFGNNVSNVAKSVSRNVGNTLRKTGSRVVVSFQDIANKFSRNTAIMVQNTGKEIKALPGKLKSDLENANDTSVIETGLSISDRVFHGIKSGISILAFPVTPLLSVISLMTLKTVKDRKSVKSKVDQYYKYKSNLEIVNTKIADIEQSSYEDEASRDLALKEKYNLIKVRNTLEAGMKQLDGSYRNIKAVNSSGNDQMNNRYGSGRLADYD